ncbi:MAG: trypsin-like serine protease [Luteolibacter sp.]
MRFPLQLSLLFLTAATSHAIEFRSYSSSRHDRFINSSTELNPVAYYVSSRYTGVGFATQGTDGRQYALVTPEHVLFAKHFQLGLGTKIRFLNASGQEFNRTTISATQVPNGSGGVADVVILKLNAPLPTDQGIIPIPYLNLANENLYNNTVLTMFGNSRRAGRGRISAFTDFSQESANIDSTRTYNSVYTTFAGNQDDAYVVTGDSGSPSFATVNNRPALVGIHLAAGTTPTANLTIDTFIPHYATTINGLLAPEGYQLIKAYPDSVTLTSGIANDPLRQAESASLEITINNTSANTAANPRLNLLFPTGAIPASVTAPGWIVDNPSPGDYRLRSATLAGNSSITATISYTAVPSVTEISIQATHSSDGSPSIQETFDLPVTETFAGFTAGLALQGELDDPDFDGLSNLLEYAFGGNPGSNSNLATGGYPLAPQSSEVGDFLTFTYARRTDAAARGLSYQTEFSETLEAASWSATLPAGASSSAAPFGPDVPGFEQVSVSIPTTAPSKTFVRVKVTLDE